MLWLDYPAGHKNSTTGGYNDNRGNEGSAT
jgi:hypothetical protein